MQALTQRAFVPFPHPSFRSPRTDRVYFMCVCGGTGSPGMKVHSADHIVREFWKITLNSAFGFQEYGQGVHKPLCHDQKVREGAVQGRHTI